MRSTSNLISSLKNTPGEGWVWFLNQLVRVSLTLLMASSSWSCSSESRDMMIIIYFKQSQIGRHHRNFTPSRIIVFYTFVQVFVWVRLLKEIRQRVYRTSMWNSFNLQFRQKSWQFFSMRDCSSSEQKTTRSSVQSGSAMLTIHIQYWWFFLMVLLRSFSILHLPNWWWVAVISFRSTVSTLPPTPAISNLDSPSFLLKLISIFWTALSLFSRPFSFTKMQSYSMESSDRNLLCQFSRCSMSSLVLQVFSSSQRMHLRMSASNMCLQVMWISFFTYHGSALQLGHRFQLLAMISQSVWQKMRSHFQHSLGQSRGMQQQTGQVISSCFRNDSFPIHFSSITISQGYWVSSWWQSMLSAPYSIRLLTIQVQPGNNIPIWVNLREEDCKQDMIRCACMHMECIVLIMSNPSQKQRPALQRLKEQAQRKGDIQSFIRAYQLKQKAVKQLLLIYSRHFFTEHFASTFKAAVALLVVPSLTNIYYAVRSHSILSGVMPFAVPVVCLTNYIYFLNRDMQQFALSSHPDAEEARSQYQIIYQFSYYDRNNESFMKKMENFRTDQSRNQKK